ncbi:17493_t:CDS:1, partial [Dentiscutata erythropus]
RHANMDDYEIIDNNEYYSDEYNYEIVEGSRISAKAKTFLSAATTPSV